MLVALLSCMATAPTAIYRCPAAEAETYGLKRVIAEEGFDAFCLDPKPGPKARAEAEGKFAFVTPQSIDTDANLKWRNATVAYARGEMSPAAWLQKTKGLRATLHFLTNSKTKSLRDTMADVPIPPMGTFSGRSVFAELFLLAWPGVPVLTSTDIWKTRELPDAGKLQSWVLAMNDYVGPMLSIRSGYRAAVHKEPKILVADRKPGLFAFQTTDGRKVWTFYLNNSRKPILMPKVDEGRITIHRGWNADDNQLMDTGFFIVGPATD